MATAELQTAQAQCRTCHGSGYLDAEGTIPCPRDARYRNDETLLLSLTVGDVQEEAEHLIGRRLTDDQLRRVEKGLNYYGGELLAETLAEAIQQATG